MDFFIILCYNVKQYILRGIIMNVVIVDGQGGQLGCQIIKAINIRFITLIIKSYMNEDIKPISPILSLKIKKIKRIIFE